MADSREYNPWMRPSEPEPIWKPLGDEDMIQKLNDYVNNKSDIILRNINYQLNSKPKKFYDSLTNKEFSLYSKNKKTSFNQGDLNKIKDKITKEEIYNIINNYKYYNTQSNLINFKDKLLGLNVIKINEDGTILYDYNKYKVYLESDIIEALMLEYCTLNISGGKKTKKRKVKSKKRKVKRSKKYIK